MSGHHVHASAGDLLQYLRSHPKTIGELCRASGLARSTVCDRLRELEGAGLIALTDPAPSSGGRPAGRYAVRCGPDILLLAAHASGRAIRAAVRTNAGKLVAETGVQPTDDCAEVPRAVTAAWEELITKAACGGATVAACTLIIDDHPRGSERIRAVPLAHARGTLSSGTIAGLPLAVIRTSDALAIRAAAAAGHGGRNVLYVDRNAPQSASWVVDGVVQRGSDGLAGTLTLPGRPAAHASLSGHGPHTCDDRENGRRLGAALATCVAILNPSLILVGGADDLATADYLAGVLETVYALAPPMAGGALAVQTINNSSDAAMEAACYLAREAALDTENVNRLVRFSTTTLQVSSLRNKAGAVA